MVVPDLPCLEDSLLDDGEAADVIVGAIDVWMHLVAYCWQLECKVTMIQLILAKLELSCVKVLCVIS